MRAFYVSVAAAMMVAGSVAASPTRPGYHVTASLPGPDGGWDYVSVDPATHRLYIAHGTSITAFDLGTGAVTPALIKTQRAHSALPIPGTTRVLATDGQANTAIIFEGKTGEVIATIPVGDKPDAAAWDPATKTLWVMNGKSGDASVIDPVTAKVIATVKIGGALEFAAADGMGRMFVNVEDKNEVAVLDTRKHTLVGRFPLNGCEEPSGLAYADKAKVLISACSNGVAKVSTRDGREVATLKIGPHPDATLYDAKRELAFIPSGGDGTLAVIRVAGPTKVSVIETVTTAKGARTGAVDPSSGNVYLPTARFGPPTSPKGYPVVLPGSFAVMVIAP